LPITGELLRGSLLERTAQLLHKFDFPAAGRIELCVDDAIKIGRNFQFPFA
jgi:hypothetical protein